MVPKRSRILLVGHADAPDYSLFSPGTRYANTVVPWGKTPFDPARMRLLIDSQKVTHVLIQHDERVLLHWEPNMRTEEMVAWLAREAGLNEITLGTTHMRLFETSHSIERYERPFHTTVVPASTPLIRIGDTLQQQVGIDPMFLKTRMGGRGWQQWRPLVDGARPRRRGWSLVSGRARSAPSICGSMSQQGRASRLRIAWSCCC